MREARVHGRIGRHEIEREIVSKSEAIRGNQARVHGRIGRHEIEREIVRLLGLDETRRRVERVPKVDHLRGGQSCAISGHQRPSVAISRHQCTLDTSFGSALSAPRYQYSASSSLPSTFSALARL